MSSLGIIQIYIGLTPKISIKTPNISTIQQIKLAYPDDYIAMEFISFNLNTGKKKYCGFFHPYPDISLESISKIFTSLVDDVFHCDSVNINQTLYDMYDRLDDETKDLFYDIIFPSGRSDNIYPKSARIIH